MTFASMLNDRCDVQRRQGTVTNDRGQRVVTWQTLASNLPCAFMPARRGLAGQELVGLGPNVAFADFRVFLLPTDVTEQDRLLITSLGARATDVIFVLPIRGHHLEVLVKVVR